MSENTMETSLINLSQNAFKTVILINGGAVVALLTFLGNIWAKDPTTVTVVSLLAESIRFFSIGVLTGALGSGTIYICNYLYAIRKQGMAITFHVLTLVLAISSYVCFGFGAYSAHIAFLTGFIK